MADIKLTLTHDEVNLIIEALGGMTFARVYKLFSKIEQQVQSQTKEAPE